MNYVDFAKPSIVSICRGIGMLDEAVKLVIPGARVVCSAEWEAYANAVYLARMEEKSVEEHPIWCGDIAGLSLSFLRGLVDIFAAGLPCQPYSLAGNQDGNIDHRSWGNGDGPIPHCLRLIGECCPALVFLENVSAWVRGPDQWFRPFGDELCRMGYTLVEPVFISASDVGASHARERVFVLGYASGLLHPRQQYANPGEARHRGEELADADDHGQRAGGRQGQESAPEQKHPVTGCGVVGDTQVEGGQRGLRQARPEQDGPGPENAIRTLAEPASPGRAKRRGKGRLRQLPTAQRSSPFIFAPGPRSDQWPAIIADTPNLAPAIEPGFCVLVDGLAYVVDQSRADQLRCSGNGVVALQAAVAFAELLRRAGVT